MQRGAFTTALNCSGRQHGIEKGRTKKGTSASRLRGQTAFLIMSACRLSGGAPYYPRDFGPSPERSLAAFVSVGPPGCSQQYAVSPVLLAVLQAVLGCSPCSSGTHGMYFSTYMPCHLDMPPCGRLSGLAPSSDLAGSMAPCKRRGGMSSLLGRSGSGRPLSTYYFMRLLYYVRDASNSILCHYRMPHGISRIIFTPVFTRTFITRMEATVRRATRRFFLCAVHR